MKNTDQRGLIGLVELGALALLIGVVGFTAYRINTINVEVDKSLSNTESASESQQVDAIKIKEEEKPKEVTVPEPEATKTPVQEPTKPDETKQETEETKKKITYIDFSSVSAVQQDDNVVVTSTLKSAQTGTCNYKFLKEGQDKVYVTGSISSSTNCNKTIPVSSFEAAGTWEFHLWFTSKDGLVQAYSDKFNVEVTL